MEFFNLNKILNQFADRKITFIKHCCKDDLYKCFLQFKNNSLKDERATNNAILGTVGTIYLGTYNLSKTFLIYRSVILTG